MNANYRILFVTLGLSMLGSLAGAQVRLPQQQQIPGNTHLFNPFDVKFTQSWQFGLTDPVKLIEIAPVTGNQENLVMVVSSRDPHDPRRTLTVSHWDGFRFGADFTYDYLGKSTDMLLAGHFHVPKPPAAPVAAAGAISATAPPPPDPSTKKKKPKNAPSPDQEQQVITTDGVYRWDGKTLIRLFGAPADIKLSVDRPGSTNELVAGHGELAQLVEVGDADIHSITVNPPFDGPGYARTGTGTQEFTSSGVYDFSPGVEFVQSYWKEHSHWVVGLIRGTPKPTKDDPEATSGDKLIVYTPDQGAVDKSFWAMKRGDFTESWRSDPLPGRILDVRIGDPKNEGHTGILVLSADDNGGGRHLLFYLPVMANGFRLQ